MWEREGMSQTMTCYVVKDKRPLNLMVEHAQGNLNQHMPYMLIFFTNPSSRTLYLWMLKNITHRLQKPAHLFVSWGDELQRKLPNCCTILELAENVNESLPILETTFPLHITTACYSVCSKLRVNFQSCSAPCCVEPVSNETGGMSDTQHCSQKTH